MDRTTTNSSGEQATKGRGLLAGAIASGLFALTFGILFWTVMDVSRPDGPAVAFSQLIAAR